MGKSADDNSWLEELAGARDGEPDDGSEHPVDETPPGDETQDPGTGGTDDAQFKDGDGGQDPGPESQTVPLAVMLEERTKLQAKIDNLENQNRDVTSRLEKLAALEADIRAMRQAQENPPEPVPDYLEDPKGYVDSKEKSLGQQLLEIGNQVKEIKTAQEEVTAETEQQKQIQAVSQAAAASEAEFVKKTPDYWDALDHVRSVRAQQIQLAMPNLNQNQIAQQISREELATAAMILQQGRDSAEYVYALAKSFGYTPAKPGDDKGDQNADVNQDELEEKRRQAAGLRGSGAPRGSLDDLMSAPADEFDQAMSEMFGSRR